MKLYSTKSPNHQVSLKQAIFSSLPPDNGLYMPTTIPRLDSSFLNSLKDQSFQEIAFEVAKTLIGNDVEQDALKRIIEEAINFPAPIVEIEKNLFVLELFHGPSMAFKDFGARFMSRLMQYFLKEDQKEIDILVATSGDTGGAVALGFYNVPGIRVSILYPKGKVSPLQEKQLTTLGGNIQAYEVNGTFDDCQKIVKTAFLDEALNKKWNLSSANSINIARLIPQTFYYFNAVAQLQRKGIDKPIIFSVPSGNFGNITAGLFAQKMGLPIAHFVASTNVNDEVPQYLKTGLFDPKPSIHTLSNAMDVGNPSNFARMVELYDDDVEKMRSAIKGYAYTDEQTLQAIEKVFDKSQYVLCPHTAIAYSGLKKYLSEEAKGGVGVFLSTAHPCKFPNVYEEDIWEQVEQPSQTQLFEGKEKQATAIGNTFEDFKAVFDR